MLITVAVCAVALLIVGFPIWATFLVSSILGLYFHTTVPMGVIVQNLFGSLDKIVLLAIPGFIFAGEIMGHSGMSKRLVDWSGSITNRIPGGLPLTTIGASALFGAITGASVAAVAAIGKIVYPGLREKGYSEQFSLGLITAVGAIDLVIPPSIPMVIFASLTNVSLGKLFMAGFLPGVVIALCVSAYCVWHSYRHGLTSNEPFSFRRFLSMTKNAGWTLGAPLLIFGGIYGGIFTPTEAAGVVCAYALIVALFIQRTMNWQRVQQAARTTAMLSGQLLLIVASASVFSYVLTVGQVPQKVLSTLEFLSLQPWMILVLINVILLIAGMFIDPTSALLVMTPLVLPMAQHAGIDLIHLGLIMTVNLAIGMFTPPFGLNIFAAAAIFKVPATRISRGIVPFLAAYLVALVIITYVPSLSLWLPSLMR